MDVRRPDPGAESAGKGERPQTPKRRTLTARIFRRLVVAPMLRRWRALRRLPLRARIAVWRATATVAQWLIQPRIVIALVFATVIEVVAAFGASAHAFYLIYVSASLLLGLVCSTTLVWMLDAWRTPEASERTGQSVDPRPTRYSFSLIVPARHEELVLEGTLTRMVETDHPDFELIVVLGSDDTGTQVVAQRVVDAHPDLVRIVIDESWPKNKPKALNTALPHCRGDIVGVFDAEDDVHPDLIRRVDQCFQKTDADVVQAGVQLMNLHSNWFAVRNVLEYFFWFRSRLHFHARAGFIPLGGNSVFVRTDLIREVGGWDAECLAEDCELGVRLSSMQKKVVVFYEPELVTREETPPTMRAFLRQRTRWNQGYLQTLGRGYWRRLPARQRILGLYTLAMPCLLALAWILIPAAIATAILVRAPVAASLISFAPAFPMVTVLFAEFAALGDFCRTFGERATVRDYARLAIGLPFYTAALAFAAARAVGREATGSRGWAKTAHYGLHFARPKVEWGQAGRAASAATGAPAGRVPPPRPATAPVAVMSDQGGGIAVLDHPPADVGTGRDRGEAVSNGDIATVNGFGGLGTVAVDDIAATIGFDGGAENRTIEVPDDRPQDGDGADVDAGSADDLRWVDDDLPRAEDDLPELRRLDVLRYTVRRVVTAHPDAATLTPLLIAVGLLQLINMRHWPNPFFDEGTYVANAWAVQAHGVLSNYTYGYGHPPLAWLLITAWTWVHSGFGHTVYSLDTARELLFGVAMVSAWLMYVLARRLGLGRPFAAVAVVAFTASPLEIYFHRLVLLDNFAVMFVLAAFVLASSPSRRLWTFAASGACLAASVLSKETAAIFVPLVLLVAIQHFDRRTRRYCFTLLAAFFALIGASYPLYAVLKGELIPGKGHVSLIGEMYTQLVSRQASGSILDRHSPAHGVIANWLHLDPWLLGVALVLSPLAMARRETRWMAIGYVVQVLLVFRPGYLPFMYVIGVMPFAAITIAAGIESLWAVTVRARSKAGRAERRRPLSARAWRGAAAAVSARPLAIPLLALALVVGGAWARIDKTTLTTQPDNGGRQAEAWLTRNVGRDQRIIVDSNFWVYLIEHGFNGDPAKGGFYSHTVVWNWPLDFDPAVQRYFPDGWKDFDYIVSTDGIRANTSQTPNSEAALDHSFVVASFGTGVDRVEIREIVRPPTPATAGAPAAGTTTAQA